MNYLSHNIQVQIYTEMFSKIYVPIYLKEINLIFIQPCFIYNNVSINLHQIVLFQFLFSYCLTLRRIWFVHSCSQFRWLSYTKLLLRPVTNFVPHRCNPFGITQLVLRPCSFGHQLSNGLVYFLGLSYSCFHIFNIIIFSGFGYCRYC